MLTKKDKALIFSFRQHLFYAIEAKIGLVRFVDRTKGINQTCFLLQVISLNH